MHARTRGTRRALIALATVAITAASTSSAQAALLNLGRASASGPTASASALSVGSVSLAPSSQNSGKAESSLLAVGETKLVPASSSGDGVATRLLPINSQSTEAGGVVVGIDGCGYGETATICVLGPVSEAGGTYGAASRTAEVLVQSGPDTGVYVVGPVSSSFANDCGAHAGSLLGYVAVGAGPAEGPLGGDTIENAINEALEGPSASDPDPC
jgi:hypothetical protein